MAKGKHATALFEVMNKTKFAGGRNGSSGGGGGGGGLATPKWWFKSNNAGGDSRPAPVAIEAPQQTVADTSDYVDETPVRQAPVVIPPLASSIEVPSPSPAATTPRTQPVAVSVDPDRQLINLRMSYTSALIGGFGIFIALGLAVLIGKGFTRGPSPAIASTSTQQLKQRPPTAGVLNVQRRSDVSVGSNDTVEGSAPRVAGNTVSTGTRNPQQSFNDPRPPATFFTDDAHRQNGLNYAIIQSYPDKETAEKAAEFLTKNGIPCTVEQNLPNWKLPWPNGCVVVGIRGFAKVTNNPALDAYKKSIMDVSTKFTNGRSRFAGFAVSMYSWKKSN
jgi:hypothetical protein